MHLDTGVMLELFDRKPQDPLVQRIRERVGNEPLFWSVVQFAELADACRRAGKPVEEHAAKVRNLVQVVPVDEAMALLASELKHEARRHKVAKNFALLDGLILATARSQKQTLLTLDPEFGIFSDAVVLSMR